VSGFATAEISPNGLDWARQKVTLADEFLASREGGYTSNFSARWMLSINVDDPNLPSTRASTDVQS